MPIRSSATARSIAGAVAVTLLVASASPAAKPTPTVQIEPHVGFQLEEIRANDQFMWYFQVTIRNPLRVGLFVDSLVCRIDDLGPGRTHDERGRTVPIRSITEWQPTISAGDSVSFRYHGIALYEDARLSFRLSSHTADGTRHTATTSIVAKPGLNSKRYRSTFLEQDGRKIEIVDVRTTRGSVDRAAGLLLVHGHGTHAREWLRLAGDLADKGFTMTAVSLPGYGLSEGEPDFQGSTSERAVEAALFHLRRQPGVDSTRLGAWGVSLGASAVASLASRHPELLAIVLQSGIYDLPLLARSSASSLADSILRQAGPDTATWIKRSVQRTASKIRVATLVQHGSGDTLVTKEQSERLAASLRDRGVDLEVQIFEAPDHAQPTTEASKRAIEFLVKRMEPLRRH